MRFQLERRGLLVVLSAPSGGGKSAVLKRLLRSDRQINYSVSYTSRPPRPKESDGREFHFVSPARFKKMIVAGEFYEHAEVHGHLYGTSAIVIEEALRDRRDIAMDLDVKGGLNMKKRRPESILIFLMPPSMSLLERRLRRRASDAEKQIKIRMKNAIREIKYWSRYDYVVVNDRMDRTVSEVRQIIHSERLRASRYSLSKIG